MKYIPNKLLVFISILLLFAPVYCVLAGIIISPHKYAWSNNIGYINFGGVIVDDSTLSGYAWSANKGFIKFNPARGGVLNDGTGTLSGFAWGEQLGWVDFGGVTIDGAGNFTGAATGDLVGTITFDCHFCDVETDWRRPAVVSTPTAAPSGGGQGGGVFSAALLTGATPEKLPASIEITSGKVSKPAEGEKIPTPIQNLTPKGRLISAFPPLFDVVSAPAGRRVDTESAGLVLRVAPGELLPISVKLSNFGGGKKVDVLVKYYILTDSGVEIYSSEETVAVETTASFVKTIQVPFGAAPGIYFAKTAIVYGGQLVPATTQFPFTVERKILGIFQSDFILYSGIILILGVLLFYLARLFAEHRRLARFTPFDYSDIPHDERVFFELLSDTIMSMRQRVGDQAIEVARKVDGMVVDDKTGRVLKITGSPSKVIAGLVSGYEKALGKKVSFSFRKEN
ncbi:MAG: hypothetical protein HY226_03785 [Candidatus Vogelbacteria bacterium]|nr:hypothetical protein [Candidatus Vogelbacteria bacterium]